MSWLSLLYDIPHPKIESLNKLHERKTVEVVVEPHVIYGKVQNLKVHNLRYINHLRELNECFTIGLSIFLETVFGIQVSGVTEQKIPHMITFALTKTTKRRNLTECSG